jgi:hypothetical protein
MRGEFQVPLLALIPDLMQSNWTNFAKTGDPNGGIHTPREQAPARREDTDADAPSPYGA